MIRTRREIVPGSCTFPHDLLGDRDHHHLKVLIHLISFPWYGLWEGRKSILSRMTPDSDETAPLVIASAPARRYYTNLHPARWDHAACWDQNLSTRVNCCLWVTARCSMVPRILFTMAESTIEGSGWRWPRPQRRCLTHVGGKGNWLLMKPNHLYRQRNFIVPRYTDKESKHST